MQKKFTQDDVLQIIRREVDATSLRQTATRVGIAPSYLSDILNGNRAVSEEIARKFGFEREIVTKVTFRKRAA
jgi:transcriptional regulator with XRE-family HTH domain